MPDPVSTEPLRALLGAVARQGAVIRYQEVALSLGLRPPGTIQAVARLLETSMAEDAAHNAPFIAALVVSRTGEALPARGFFDMARALGRLEAGAAEADERAFHARERANATTFHGARDCPEP